MPAPTPMALVEAVVLRHPTQRTFWDKTLAEASVEQFAGLRRRVAPEILRPVQCDSRSAPLLHHAAGRGDAWSVKTLIALGASPHQCDAEGALPLEWAIIGQHLELARWLWEQGLPERPPVVAPTLMHSVAIAGEAFASDAEGRMTWPISIWDGFDRFGRRPLHCAADANDEAVARVLVRMGARPGACNGQGQTPVERHAERHPHAGDGFAAALEQRAPRHQRGGFRP